MDGAVMHPARPGCMLTLDVVERRRGDATITFNCDGCKMPGGAGPRYTSVNPRSNLVLHKDCALAPHTRQHQLVKKGMLKLELRHEAPTGIDAVVCDACYGKVKGFHYHCSTGGESSYDLHPCCANMPLSLTYQNIKFELRKKVKHRCTGCREMEWYDRPWCYRSTNNPDQRVYLHIKCILKMMEGGDDDERVMARLLQRAGQRTAVEKHIYKILLILVRVVIRTLLGDPTAIVTEGLNAVASMATP